MQHFLSDAASLLIVPSATMAEHVRNELARSGEAVRPARIITLTRFLDQMGSPAAASPMALEFAIDGALSKLRPARFLEVAEYRGFRRAIAALLQEAPESGLPADLHQIATEVRADLQARGMALHNARARDATASRGLCPSTIVFDGFFGFSHDELGLLESLPSRARVVVTLPDGAGAASARGRLRACGFAETRMERSYRTPQREVFCAATLEQEVEEIARRIVNDVSRGRAFREMGIVLRARDPYAAALETTLARFGIPARFHFADSLPSHPAIEYLSGLVRAALGGWDHAELLALLRMPVSGLGATVAGDRLDFALREALPGRGLPIPGLPETLAESFAEINGWLRDRAAPNEWAARVTSLRKLIPAPEIDGAILPDRLRAWTSTAAAFDAFEIAIDQAAQLTGNQKITLPEFWTRAEAAMELAELRVPDRRRDVVHVIDVFEARQWELPMVFVCGMVERHFPQYHREDAILNDAARQRAGMQTSAHLQHEERSLFELATSRATEQVILSFPRFEERGEETLPSFFLDKTPVVRLGAERIRPRPSRSMARPAGQAEIHDPELRQQIRAKYRTLSPSSIESFLQCPFQFFGRKTLNLRERPPAPRDRLNALLQGTIIHAAIAELERMPLLGAAILDSVFAQEAARNRIPMVYRTETVRLEMARNFTAFLTRRDTGLGWNARVEEPFEIELTPRLHIRGRIDRLEIGPQREALVIDYKYSAASAIKQKVKGQEEGEAVQAGLYLLAAVQQFGFEPAGMLYCGLKKDVEWGGWHLRLQGLEEIGESCTRTVLDEMTAKAAEFAIRAHESIGTGEIAVRPADSKKCNWCEYRDVCRIESVLK